MATFIQLALRLILLAKMISCEFTNPGKHGVTLFVGDTIHIAYRNITFKSYSIALWQQLPSGDAASLGPALYETTDGPSAGFDWVVQVYDFNLTYSNNFFFWIFEGDYSNQGHTAKAAAMVSGYFYMSYANKSASSSLASTATATMTAATTDATNRPTWTSTSSSGPDLSTGTKTGIAAGAAAGGIAIIGAAAFFVRYRSRKNKELKKAVDVASGSQFHPTPYNSPPPAGAPLYYKTHGAVPGLPPNDMAQAYTAGAYVDAYNRPINRVPVEMGI